MIFLCAGERSERTFDALLLLAVQLDRAGYAVGIDASFLPDDAPRYQKFEAAMYLCDAADVTPAIILMIGADSIADDVKLALRALPGTADTAVYGLGRFATHQMLLSAQNTLAYAVGRDVEVIDLTLWQGDTSLIEDSILPLVTSILPSPNPSRTQRPKVLVYAPHDSLQQDAVLPELLAMSHSGAFDLQIVTSGQGKDFIRRSSYAYLSVFGYSELPPSGLLSYADIVAFFGPNVPGARMAQLAMEAMGAGKVVIDCTEDSSFIDAGAPLLDGPASLLSFASYLEGVVLPHRAEIGRRIQQSPWLAKFDLAHLERQIGLTRPAAAPAPASKTGSTLFFPTNGSGLGHAQRCALIAAEVSPDHSTRFAAFPSCVDMLKNRGFDCLPMVQRSEEFAEEFANDLVNYRRLSSLMAPGDQLVFDGGYVFDSIYRVISASQTPAIWIRRGLWQAGQIHPNALEREHIFSKVIVPTEAFEELNAVYSRGEQVHHVGPVVNTTTSDTDRATLRARLSALFERPFETLVVSMLGGGVASDRSVQTQMLCSTLERRSDCLHLVVAWPNAVVPDGYYGWKNTRVVQTQNTLDLCRAADLTVSAAGYNSFHELLYAAVPTLFIPQSAPYLDDQERRARAASERGLAGLVLESELMSLGREVNAVLDGGKAAEFAAAHTEITLPDIGNKAAAALIETGAGQ
jgi:hypothetical protein